jgi:hypothetical protein
MALILAMAVGRVIRVEGGRAAIDAGQFVGHKIGDFVRAHRTSTQPIGRAALRLAEPPAETNVIQFPLSEPHNRAA